MQTTVDDALGEVDAVLVLLNATETFGSGDRYIAQAVAASGVPAVVLLNKIDLVDGPKLGARLEEARALSGGAEVLAVSACGGTASPTSSPGCRPPCRPARCTSPRASRATSRSSCSSPSSCANRRCALTREEVPHAIAAEVTSITERDDKPLVEIEANVIVETESQKAIVVGKGGRVIKAIGSGARHEIEAILGVQVFLALRVKVRKRWRKRRPLHRALL